MRFFRRSQRDFEDEVRAHLELETDQLIAEGRSPRDAREEARRRFGNVGQAQERYYDASPVVWLRDAVGDARYALRMVRRHPGFSASVILIATLGVVACVTTFSLVSGILLKPLPFPGSDRVFQVQMRGPGIETAALPLMTYEALSQSPEVDAIGAYAPARVTMRLDGELSFSTAMRVTPAWFRVFRIRPAVGRFFDEKDVAGAERVVVLGYEEWRARFGADSSIVGRFISLDGVPNRIVGVMPPRFRHHSMAVYALWRPLTIDPSGRRPVNAVLRMPDSVPTPAAQLALRRHRAMVENFDTRDSVMTAVAVTPIAEAISGYARESLLILLAAVLLVLALVAANVATMFLAQVSARREELDVRRALGAGRGRQLRQLVVESMTLTCIGGLIGIACSAALVAYVRVLGVRVLPRIEEVSIDWRVALFALAAIVVMGLSGGFAQVFASRTGGVSRSSSRVTSARTSTLLVTVQVALSVVLLIGSGLLVKGFMRVAPNSPGFTIENRATLLVSLAADSTSDPHATIRSIQARLRTTPGVSDVTVGSFLPLTGMVAIVDVLLADPASKRPTGYSYVVSDNYFAVMGMTIRAGRGFGSTDRSGSDPVAVISETAVQRWFGSGDPIGRRLTIGDGKDQRVVTVIGVTNDTRVVGHDTRMRPQIYFPLEQSRAYGMTFIAATSVEPAGVMPALRRALASAAPNVTVETALDLATIAGTSVKHARFFSVAMALFAGAAVLLTGLGVYGLLSFAVSQRRREIGIRLALGATTSRIGRSVAGRTIGITVVGVTAGVALAYALSRYMESLLVEVKPTDAAVFIAAPAIAILFALAATVAPVYQATHIDPNETMRN